MNPFAPIDKSSPRASLQEIFLAAREITDAAQRKQYLNDVVGDDHDLRRRVELMLVSQQDSQPNPLLRAVELLDLTAFDSANDSSIDVREHPQIGPYKILDRLGTGGMGEVFVAEQRRPVQRTVALKLIKRGMDSNDVIARFEAERQALAMMSHPNIARVLDAGQTEDGRPYFVMDLVRGFPITKYCDGHKLDLRERLKIFVTVCQAVQHAHQKGIIHRDLKPGNILVELDDVRHVPKVIDFGVAKATNQRLTERTLFTQMSQMIGTPLYMSPEQAQLNSLDVDTRSDVYSLGVLLYELLTGSTPFNSETLKRAGFDEMRRIIREDEPPRPSARVSTLENKVASTVSFQRQTDRRQLSLTMKRELDWIVMRAMEKDRTRRYESASAMSQDIQRYLDGDAVQACPPSTLYRTTKLIRRNKALFTTAASIAIALLVGIGVASWQAIRAAAAEQLASTEQENAERNLEAAMDAIEQLLVHVGKPELAKIPAIDDIRKEILRDSLDFYERFTIKSGTSSRIDFRAGKVLMELATLAMQSLDRDSVIQAYSQSLALADQLVLLHPDNLEYRRLQADANFSFGTYYDRLSTHGASDKHHATTYLSHADQQFAQLAIMDPSNKDYNAHRGLALLALTMNRLDVSANYADVEADAIRAYELTEKSIPAVATIRFLAQLNASKNPKLAEEYYQRAIALSLSGVSAQPPPPISQAFLCDEAASFYTTRDASEAERLWEISIAIAVQEVRDFPSLERYREMCQKCMRRYVGFLRSQGRSTEAIEKMRGWIAEIPTLHHINADLIVSIEDSDKRLEMLSDAIAKYPDQSVYYDARNSYHQQNGDFEAAIADLSSAIAITDKDQGSYIRSRGNLFYKTGEYSEAIEDYSTNIAKFAITLDFKRRANSYFRLNKFDECMRDLSDAMKLHAADLSALTWIPTTEIAACSNQPFREAFLNLVDRTVDAHARSSEVLTTRAAIQCAFGNWDEARRDLAEVIAGKEVQAYTLYQAGLLALATGDIGEYRATSQRLVAEYGDTDDALAHHFVAWTCALAPGAIDDYAAAIRHAKNAIATDVADQQYLLGLGAILMRAGQLEEAKAKLEKALELAGNDKSSTAYVRYFLALTEQQMRHGDEAQRHLQTANESAEKELADSPAWNRKLTFEILKRETQTLVEKANTSLHTGLDSDQVP